MELLLTDVYPETGGLSGSDSINLVTSALKILKFVCTVILLGRAVLGKPLTKALTKPLTKPLTNPLTEALTKPLTKFLLFDNVMSNMN